MINQAALVSFLLAASISAVESATTVSVIELGKRGSVRRTTTVHTDVTAIGVASFWGALHGRKLQHSGMPVVPDLFHKADSSVVIGLQGAALDLGHLPYLQSLTTSANEDVVGHMELTGTRCDDLMKHVGPAPIVETGNVADSAASQGRDGGMSGFRVAINSDSDATQVEEQIKEMLSKMDQEAKEAGRTIVVHLIVEEDDAAVRRRGGNVPPEIVAHSKRQRKEHRFTARRLQQEKEKHRRLEEDNQGNQNGGSSNSGYGYVNSFGEWVTPVKSMFQIQYYNVVLWTSLGLATVLFVTVFFMVYMPLEPDTLLFGESAKAVGSD
jgi:hypothetical protein